MTGAAEDPSTTTDGLFISNAKIQAFQSNLTTATPPITLDAQALGQLLSVKNFSDWYEQGGVIVSDALWNQAIRRYYEQQAAEFRPALIARDALLAGNDVLLLTGLDRNGAVDPYQAVIDTVDFFAQKYRDDQAFAQQVDEAVLRILTLKYEMYSSFDSASILPVSTRLEEIGTSNDVVFEVARQSATLIDPSRENFASVLPSAPGPEDRIVIISDGYTYQQCDTCDSQLYPDTNTLQQIVLRLYGEAGDQLISRTNITSFSSSDLLAALDHSGPGEPPVITEMRRARWVVFLFMGSDTARPESGALVRFLSEMPDLIQDKKTIVFSLTAPYYLDATSISQVSAYYGLYSKAPQFLEIAARLVFQEVIAPGASPVSIAGTGYLLEEALLPDTAQTITLQLVSSAQVSDGGATATPAPRLHFQGETILLETSEIVDSNGNPVVDNTLLNFTLVSTGTDGATSQREVTAYTIDGKARINQLLDTVGILEATAYIGDSEIVSNTLLIEVGPNENVGSNGAGAATPTGLATGEPDNDENGSGAQPGTTLVDWLISLIVIVFISLFSYQLGAFSTNVRWAVRWGLSTFIGGLTANAYLSFGMLGSETLIENYGIWGIVVCVAAGCVFGWVFGVVWRLIAQRNVSHVDQ